ncbi:MAG: hypothetical protein KDD49_03880 [Bacteroidetes bacterium]|nr:hypothetical protein [Bacteroidota bacterium]
MRNITTKELFVLPPDKFNKYYNTLKHLAPKSEINGIAAPVIEELTFAQVAMLKKMTSTPDYTNLTKVFELVFGVGIENMDVVSFFAGFNYIIESLKTINKREQMLNAKDPKWEAAGIDKLGIFGALNQLAAIAQQFSTSPQDVENWSYSLVFALSYKNKIEAEILKNYQEQNKLV